MAGRGERWRPCDRAVRPSFVQGIGAVRGRGGLGCGGARVSTPPGSKGRAGERCGDAEGHCPGGRTDGRTDRNGRTGGQTDGQSKGLLRPPGGHPVPPSRSPSGLQQWRAADSGGSPVGMRGAEPGSAPGVRVPAGASVSGVRGPAAGPSHSVRSLSSGPSLVGGVGVGCWAPRFPSTDRPGSDSALRLGTPELPSSPFSPSPLAPGAQPTRRVLCKKGVLTFAPGLWA